MTIVLPSGGQVLGRQTGEPAANMTFQPAVLFIFIGFLIAFMIHTIIRHARRRRRIFQSQSPSSLQQEQQANLVAPARPEPVYTDDDLNLARAARDLPADAIPSRSVLRKARRARVLMEELPKDKPSTFKLNDDEEKYSEEEDDGICAICLDPLDDTVDCTHGQCGHIMHHHCLQFWLARDRALTCPVCRVRITPSSNTPSNSTDKSNTNEVENKNLIKDDVVTGTESFASSASSSRQSARPLTLVLPPNDSILQLSPRQVQGPSPAVSTRIQV